MNSSALHFGATTTARARATDGDENDVILKGTTIPSIAVDAPGGSAQAVATRTTNAATANNLWYRNRPSGPQRGYDEESSSHRANPNPANGIKKALLTPPSAMA